MILDHVEDLEVLLDKLTSDSHRLRLDVASRLFILVWALAFKVVPPSFLVGKSLDQLKASVSVRDPMRELMKIAIGCIYTTNGYAASDTNLRKYKWCFLGFHVIMMLERNGRIFFVERVVQVRNAHGSGSHLAENLLTAAARGGAPEVAARRERACAVLQDLKHSGGTLGACAEVEPMDLEKLVRVRCLDYDELSEMRRLADAHSLTHQISGVDLRDGFDDMVEAAREADPCDVLLERVIMHQGEGLIPTMGGEMVRRLPSQPRACKAPQPLHEAIPEIPSLTVEYRDGEWYPAACVSRINPWTIKIHYEGWNARYDENLDLTSPRMRADFSKLSRDDLASPEDPGLTQFRFNQRYHSRLLMKGSGIGAAVVTVEAAAAALEMLQNGWKLAVREGTPISVLTIEGTKSEATGYSLYGLVQGPHDSVLQPQVTINLAPSSDDSAMMRLFVRDERISPLIQEYEHTFPPHTHPLTAAPYPPTIFTPALLFLTGAGCTRLSLQAAWKPTIQSILGVAPPSLPQFPLRGTFLGWAVI